MFLDNYLLGSDVLGADPPQTYVVLTVRNVSDLVKKEGGAAGSLAMSLAPNTINSKVYDEIATKLRDEFKKQGVDADVRLVQAPPVGGVPVPTEFGRGALVGAGGLVLASGLGWVLWNVGKALIGGSR